MRPFPPVDGFELIEAHPRMALAVLGDSLVLLEFSPPSRYIERGNDAGHRLPFDDGETGFGKPRRTAHDHRREDQGRHREQPQPDGATAGPEGWNQDSHAMI